MAILKNIVTVSKPYADSSPETDASLSSDDDDDDDEGAGDVSASESDGSDVSEVNSGMGSDGSELSDLGEVGTELCQLGNHTFRLPLELLDLHELSSILSLQSWNELLSEEERFSLAEYLPDMDQETFALTLMELFSGKNFHFGKPLDDLLNRLKSGQFEPKVDVYRRVLNLFKKREYYHCLRKYQNSMVGGLFRMQNAWENCRGYGIQERLRLLNIVRSKSERHGDVRSVTDSENEGFNDFGGRDERKGVLKVGAPKFSLKHDAEMQRDRDVGYKLGTGRMLRNRMKVNDGGLEERGYELGKHGEWNGRFRKPVKKEQLVKGYGRSNGIGIGDEMYDGLQNSFGRLGNYSQVTVASYGHSSLGDVKKAKYLEMYSMKDQAHGHVQRGAQAKFSDGNIRIRHPYKCDGRDSGEKKWKAGGETKNFLSGKYSDSTRWSHKNFPTQSGDSQFLSAYRSKTSKAKSKCKSSQVREMDGGYSIENVKFDQNGETESDSSEQDEEDGDINPQLVCSGRNRGGYRSGILRSVYDPIKDNKLVKRDKRSHSPAIDRETIPAPEVKLFSRKGKHKGKKNEPTYLNDIKLSHPSEKSQQPFLKDYSREKRRKVMVDLDSSLMKLKHMHDFNEGETEDREDEMKQTSSSEDNQIKARRSGDRTRSTDAHTVKTAHQKGSNLTLLGCNTMAKQQKGKVDDMSMDEKDDSVYQQSSPKRQMDDTSLTKKKGKQKTDVGTGTLPVPSPESISGKGREEAELETGPQKKPFTLITPTIHTGFSFSIVHLLTAVRKAMVTCQMEDLLEDGRTLQMVNRTNPSHSLESTDVNALNQAGQPSLTVQEIVNRVRSNPGDPSILETQEPLQDLIRGVLKIFSSKTAPLGAKGWKPLAIYEKLNKSWSWIGPVTSIISDNDTVEEETSPEAWAVPHKMLLSMVNAFANWLKSGQETLQQIGSLPAPPPATIILDEKERFKDLRAQKSLNTISPSTNEVRAYFRREEVLRYSIPDRAFSYTAADGRKSIVAPLRRGAGKPTSKARDHFMLKPDRPPHITVLCLVRDAAARLPGSIGTRADVCTLIRDSQFIVENISDAQVNQVVSGALDRLHYERDPCVQFDGDRKLWVYLHRDREEEDFEDDGTSSTKKWKRPRKDAAEHFEMGRIDDVTGDPAVDGSPAGYDFNADLNVDLASIHSGAGEKMEIVYNDLRPGVENMESFIVSAPGNRSQENSATKEIIRSNPLPERQMLCQENSTNEDFGDGFLSRGKPGGLWNASLS